MSKAEESLQLDTLRVLVRMDPESGHLFWLPRTEEFFSPTKRHTAAQRCAMWNTRFAGGRALAQVNMHGYLAGYLLGQQHRAARVVFALHHGHWPQQHIDHINGVKTDDRPVNLRDVPCQENMRNRALSSNNSTGHVGVSLYMGKFDAYITVDNKKVNLGRYSDLNEAIAARKAAERKHEYHPNHGRKENAHA